MGAGVITVLEFGQVKKKKKERKKTCAGAHLYSGKIKTTLQCLSMNQPFIFHLYKCSIKAILHFTKCPLWSQI